MIENFHFLRPWWLLAILFAAAFLLLASRSTDVRSRWKGVIAPHLLDHLVIDGAGNSRFRPQHLMAGLITLAAIAAAGPTWRKEQPPFVQDTAPLVIAVDVSQTMDAIDVTPSRLERAKLKIKDILAARAGARTAVVAYAGSAHLVLPLTEDAALIETYVDALATRIMPVEGRDTTKALMAADDALFKESAAGTILLITDGVEEKAYPDFKTYQARNNILVLGIGTAEGGPVKTGTGEYLTGAGGGRVIARLDVEGLRNLHALTKTDVATVTADDSDVRWVADRIATHFNQRLAEKGNRWLDAGWWLTIPISLLAALSFRRGWVVRTAVILLMIQPVFGAGRANAAEWHFVDAWLTPDQQGRLAFERGDFEAAAAHFKDPLWRGTALYRAEKYGDAIDAFAAVNTAESYYDQGNALLHLLKFEEAVAAYSQALSLKADWPDAQANLAVAERLLAKQKDEEDEQQQEPSEKPDQIQFDKKGEKGKEGEVDIAEQTSELWMRNIQVSPADLMARKFAIEAGDAKP